MNWQKLKEESIKYPTVYITGCQRTGTTFCAKALAEEIGYKHIDESEFDADNVSKFHEIDKRKAVVQCPALFHLFPSIAQGGLIATIDREPSEVIDSMIQSQWYHEFAVWEATKYGGYPIMCVIETKKRHLKKFQEMSNVLVLPHSELQKAKGYLPKDQRKNFTIKQTE